MPTYLCHGFRWHRPSIRVYVIVQDIGDAAPDYIVGRRSARAILASFYTVFDFLPEAPPPSSSADHDDAVLSQPVASAVRLLEEHDPRRLDEATRPHAYVADHVVRVDLAMSVADEVAGYEARLGRGGGGHRGDAMMPMAGPHSDETGKRLRGAGDKKAGWLEKLRDQLQRGEEIRWYVVVNGDEEREWRDEEERDDEVTVQDDGRARERLLLRQQLGGMGLDEEEDESYFHGEDSRNDGFPRSSGSQSTEGEAGGRAKERKSGGGLRGIFRRKSQREVGESR